MTLILGMVVRMPLAFDVAEGDKFVCIRVNSWLQKTNSGLEKLRGSLFSIQRANLSISFSCFCILSSRVMQS